MPNVVAVSIILIAGSLESVRNSNTDYGGQRTDFTTLKSSFEVIRALLRMTLLQTLRTSAIETDTGDQYNHCHCD